MPSKRYQVIALASAAFLLFVCVRSYWPRPEYSLPRSQLVCESPTPTLVDHLALLGPQLADPLEVGRNTFLVHADYIPVLPPVRYADPQRGTTDELVRPDPISPNRRTAAATTDQEGLTTVGVDSPDETNLDGRQVTPPDAGSEGTMGNLTTGPEIARTGGAEDGADAALDDRDLGADLATDTSGSVSAAGTVLPPVDPAGQDDSASQAYELPFHFQGIIRVHSRGNKIAVFRDRSTGEELRRYEGQSYRGVRFLRITPSAVEMAIPERDLRLRYVRTEREWVSL